MESDRRKEEGCQLRTLARGQTAHVQHCAHCGSLSVHLGAVTLRFAPEALESVWNTLGEALIEFHAQERMHMVAGFEGRAVGEA